MSAQERSQERTLADFYEAQVRPPESDEPKRIRAKRFFGAVGTGYALGSVWRYLTR